MYKKNQIKLCTCTVYIHSQVTDAPFVSTDSFVSFSGLFIFGSGIYFLLVHFCEEQKSTSSKCIFTFQFYIYKSERSEKQKKLQTKLDSHFCFFFTIIFCSSCANDLQMNANVNPLQMYTYLLPSLPPFVECVYYAKFGACLVWHQ